MCRVPHDRPHPGGLKQVVHRLPIRPRRFHRDIVDPQILQPVDQRQQRCRVRRELPHLVPARHLDAHRDLTLVYVDSGTAFMDERQPQPGSSPSRRCPGGGRDASIDGCTPVRAHPCGRRQCVVLDKASGSDLWAGSEHQRNFDMLHPPPVGQGIPPRRLFRPVQLPSTSSEVEPAAQVGSGPLDCVFRSDRPAVSVLAAALAPLTPNAAPCLVSQWLRPAAPKRGGRRRPKQGAGMARSAHWANEQHFPMMDGEVQGNQWKCGLKL